MILNIHNIKQLIVKNWIKKSEVKISEGKSGGRGWEFWRNRSFTLDYVSIYTITYFSCAMNHLKIFLFIIYNVKIFLLLKKSIIIKDDNLFDLEKRDDYNQLPLWPLIITFDKLWFIKTFQETFKKFTSCFLYGGRALRTTFFFEILKFQKQNSKKI